MRRKGVNELVSDYRRAAIAHKTAKRAGDHRTANRAYGRLAKITIELRDRNEDEQTRFLELMDDPDIGVKLWAATHALEFAPARAEQVLKALAAGPESLEEMEARIVLEEWRKGRLRPP